MPRQPSVKHEEAVNALLCHSEELVEIYTNTRELPVRSSEFYQRVSQTLEAKWKPTDIYRNLREDRKSLRTDIFQRLGINYGLKLEIIDETSINTCIESEESDASDHNSADDEDYDNDLNRSRLISKDTDSFKLIIPYTDYEKMKPTVRIYKGRETEILEPGVWSDIINDAFFQLYELPCAYSFKKATVSRNPGNNFISIIGRCKSKTCNSSFYAVAAQEPCVGGKLMFDVRTKDTFQDHLHEPVKRQLRNFKRERIGQQLVAEGASNVRRNLAQKELRLGVVNSATVYDLPVLRKLKEETENKILGLHPADAKNPILTLLKLKHTPPYAGSIGTISLHEFFVHLFSPEQIAVMKEYCRLNPKTSQLSFDSTGSLVFPIQIDNHPPSGHIFLHELVINFNGMTVPVAQMLSAAQDTVTLEFFLNKWIQAGAPTPKTVVSDYGRAILNAVCSVYNKLTLKAYIERCFTLLETKAMSRPAVTFIRIDVSHFMAIVCRLKCFNKNNSAIKDFLVRGVALLVSSDTFERFEEILSLLLIITSHKYDGDIKGVNNTPTPSKIARVKLQEYISNEDHTVIKILPDENSVAFENNVIKLKINEQNDGQKRYLFNQEIDSDLKIIEWLKNLQKKCDLNKDIEGMIPNPFRLLEFHKKLIDLSKEFPLWTAVMTAHFGSEVIRATSSASEGQFNELKTRILRNSTTRMSVTKFFIILFKATAGTVNLAFSSIIRSRSRQIQVPMNKISVASNMNAGDDQKNFSDIVNDTDEKDDTIVKDNFMEVNKREFHIENWRDKAEKENVLLMEDLSDSPQKKSKMQSSPFKEDVISDLYDESVIDEELHLIENWRNKAIKQKSILKKKLTDSYAEAPEKKKKIRTKYFKPHPLTSLIDPQKLVNNSTNRKIDMLLINGNLFKNPLIIQGRKIIVKNTCGPDSILTILALSAKDDERYMSHIKKLTNKTFKFIANFVNLGAVRQIYIERCNLLMNYRDYVSDENTIMNENVFKSNSPAHFRIIDLFSNNASMWEYLIVHEPSMRRITKCLMGHEDIRDVPTLIVDHSIIVSQGYCALEKAVLFSSRRQNECKEAGCRRIAHENIFLNEQIYIELDVRNLEICTQGETTMSSIMCLPTDRPLYMNLRSERFRLGGIIVYTPNHYTALCRRISGKWEMYDDLSKKSYELNYQQHKVAINPAAVIYIKIIEKDECQ